MKAKHIVLPLDSAVESSFHVSICDESETTLVMALLRGIALMESSANGAQQNINEAAVLPCIFLFGPFCLADGHQCL